MGETNVLAPSAAVEVLEGVFLLFGGFGSVAKKTNLGAVYVQKLNLPHRVTAVDTLTLPNCPLLTMVRAQPAIRTMFSDVLSVSLFRQVWTPKVGLDAL